MPRDENAIVGEKKSDRVMQTILHGKRGFFPQTLSIHDNMCHTFYLCY